MYVIIKAKKDLYNAGKCFTKGQEYTTSLYNTSGVIEASLMEATVTNDMGEPHLIGSWWREFKIVN